MVRKSSERSTVCEDLHGLLQNHKGDNTYFKVLVNKEERLSMLLLVSNPLYWKNIPEDEVQNFTEMKRVELNVLKLSVNYILPEHMIYFYGANLGLGIAPHLAMIDDRLKIEGSNYFIIRCGIKYLPDIIIAVHKMVYMPPQMKYEIISNYMKDYGAVG